jgi:hypothetical protein
MREKGWDCANKILLEENVNEDILRETWALLWL